MTQLQLPESLAPWRKELSLFPIELAIDIGGIVRRLSSAIGSPAAARHRGDDPDGYDGIVRSGVYDRMLHSEWLYADEMPEEFLRRTVMHEQLFFRIARRSPLDELVSVALFDAGPTQLGGARILHLALLIVFARRCAERGGVFRWGVLQQKSRRIFERLDVDSVRAMLDLRDALEVADSDLDEWSGLLPHGDRRHRETWLVGGERLARLVERHVHASTSGREYREAGLVSIEQPIHVDDHTLDVRIRNARGVQQKLTLTLPSAQASTRLIRDPFEVAGGALLPAARISTHAPSHLMFAANGKRLITRGKDGGIVVHLLSQKVPVAKTYLSLGGEPVIAAGWGRKAGGVSIAAVQNKNELRVGALHRQGKTTKISTVGAFAWEKHCKELDRLMPVVATSHTSTLRDDYLFLDLDGNCWVTNCRDHHAYRVASNAAALIHHHGNPHFASFSGDEWKIVAVEGDRPRVIHRISGRGTAAFLARATHVGEGKYGLIAALQETESRWVVLTDEGLRINGCPVDGRVVGVTSVKGDAALVVVEKSTITLVHASSYSTVVRNTSLVEAASVDPDGPRIAYVCGDDLIVRALDHDEVLHRTKVTR